jgi:hypothetical protein
MIADEPGLPGSWHAPKGDRQPAITGPRSKAP